MEYKYQAIVLRKRDVGETDRLYTFYTLEGGKIKAIAQGVRKAQAKLAAQLENFMLVDLAIAKGRGTGRVTGSIIEESFSSLRNSFDGLQLSFEAAMQMDRLIDLGHVDRKLFQCFYELISSLNLLANRNEILLMETVFLSFMIHLLVHLGYRLETGQCVHCGKMLTGSKFLFVPQDGGFLCNQCANNHIHGGIFANENCLKFIRLASQHQITSFLKLKVSANDLAYVRKIETEFIRWIRG